MSMHHPHLERTRAESFGGSAERYERYRPDFAQSMLDDLAALRPESVLDIATGTGKVAAGLRARGVDVIGVEIDARMAEIAAGKGIAVEVAGFEDWEDQGRSFDLVTCGDAWHWIRPEVGWEKVRRILRPGGAFARVWNIVFVDPDVLAAIDDAFRSCGLDPTLRRPAVGEVLIDHNPPEVPTGFAAARAQLYRSPRAFSADEWIGYLSTVSANLALGADEWAAVDAALRATIEGLGDSIEAESGSYLLHCTI